MNVQSIASDLTASRLTKLAALYQQGQASDLTARALDKLVEYETNLAKAQLDDVQKDLAVFEARYNMTSDRFYRSYQSGKTDDRMDFVEWASLVQMAENLRHGLQLLTEQSE